MATLKDIINSVDKRACMKGRIFSNKTWTLMEGVVIHLPRGITVYPCRNNSAYTAVRLHIDGEEIEGGGIDVHGEYVLREIVRLTRALIAHVGNGSSPGSFHRHRVDPNSSLPVGVSEVYSATRGQYIFAISYPCLIRKINWTKRIAIGTEKTYDTNRESALAKAIAFREESMQLYRDEFIKYCTTLIDELNQLIKDKYCKT